MGFFTFEMNILKIKFTEGSNQHILNNSMNNLLILVCGVELDNVDDEVQELHKLGRRLDLWQPFQKERTNLEPVTMSETLNNILTYSLTMLLQYKKKIA